jgi:hypothetical protein
VAAVAAEQEGQADHTLGADNADLRGPAIREQGQHRGPAALGEVDRRDWLVGRHQDMPQLQFKPLELRLEPGEILWR